MRPFGLRDKVSYAFGDIANDFTFILASSFLLKFYTDVMGVAAGLIGVMMMVVRLADAFVDVTVGRVVDFSKPTKAGKFRPWILRGSIFVAAVSFLMYPVWFRDMPMAFKVVWLIVSYLVWSVMYSVVNIPYGSMASAITEDPGERTQLSVFRNAGATIASLVISVAVPMFVYYTNAAGNTVFNGSTFSVLAAVFSVIALVSYFVCYFGTVERVHVPSSKKESGGAFAFLGKLGHNKPFIAYCCFTVFVILGQFTMQSMANYIFPNYYGSAAAQSTVSLFMSVAVLAFSVVATPFAQRFGKKEVASVGLAIATVLSIVVFLLRPESVVVFGVFYVLAYLGMGVTNCYLFAIVVDIIDYDELANGVREDGTIYSSYSFFRKVAQSLSSGLSGVLLSAVGYTAATAFEPAVLNGVYDITCLVPALFFLVGFVVIWKFYPLGRKQVEENSAKLAAQHTKHTA